MKTLRIVYSILFRRFAGPRAIAGSSGPWQETNPNMQYN